ncbi:hypothetical protein P9X48_25520 [Bacillus cereus]|nr:hypothetical protein [Bacillus cereus]
MDKEVHGELQTQAVNKCISNYTSAIGIYYIDDPKIN